MYKLPKRFRWCLCKKTGELKIFMIAHLKNKIKKTTHPPPPRSPRPHSISVGPPVALLRQSRDRAE